MERLGSRGYDGEAWDWKNKIGPDFGSKGENGFEGLDNKACKEAEKIRHYLALGPWKEEKMPVTS